MQIVVKMFIIIIIYFYFRNRTLVTLVYTDY